MRIFAWLAWLVIFSSVSSAAPDKRAQARAAFIDASRQYDLREFRSALDGFKRAYLFQEDPAILFNIAQCHRQLSEKEEAAKFYRTFLYKMPDAPNRAEVERILTTLEDQIRAEQAAKQEPPKGTLDPQRAEPATPPPPVEPAVSKPAPKPRAALRPAGIALLAGGGALAVTGAVLAGLAAQAHGDVTAGGRYDPTAEDRRDLLQSMYPAFLAVGVAATATGIALYIVSRRSR
jgi:tetratricopeptide (TPR) repeat protein